MSAKRAIERFMTNLSPLGGYDIVVGIDEQRFPQLHAALLVAGNSREGEQPCGRILVWVYSGFLF